VYFESRLRSIESGQDDSGWLAQRLYDLDNQRTKTVSDYVQQLRVRLGEVSFRALDLWVHASFSHQLLSQSVRHCAALMLVRGLTAAKRRSPNLSPMDGRRRSPGLSFPG